MSEAAKPLYPSPFGRGWLSFAKPGEGNIVEFILPNAPPLAAWVVYYAPFALVYEIARFARRLYRKRRELDDQFPLGNPNSD